MSGIDERLAAPRGIPDTLPEKAAAILAAAEYFAGLAELYGYAPVEMPLIEKTDVFVRSVGGASEIVTKQMYTFVDKSGDSLTLRPEGTAGVVRAFVEHELYKSEPLPWRVFYMGDMFRHERPQAGRYRQFKQFGVEALGAGGPEADVEQIDLCTTFLRGVGVESPLLMLNSVGDGDCRPAYRSALQAYLRRSEVQGALCEECKQRTERNPLRVLDCKNRRCIEATAEAPATLDYLCRACSIHFDEVRAGLDAVGVPYEVAPRLVRGLDYYTRTAFEVVSGGLDAAQDAVAGGGRYDGLVELLGGPPTPGVGFAVGVERSLRASSRLGDSPGDPASRRESSRKTRIGKVPAFEPRTFGPAVLAVATHETARAEALRLVAAAREEGIPASVGPLDRSLKAQMRYADRVGAAAVAVFGPEELEAGEVSLRLLRSEGGASGDRQSQQRQERVRVGEAPARLKELLS